jgi:hypothetical protein
VTKNQLDALQYLVSRGATPSSGYWCPLWSMEPPHVGYIGDFDGRTFESLRRRGLVTKIEAHDRRGAYQLTEAGAVEAGFPNLLVVLLPDPEHEDGTTHYARRGHVNTVCGAERYTNGDVLDSTEVPMCHDCLRLASQSGYQHPLVQGGNR